MDIRPPYGYREIVPLTRTQRVRLPGERALPAAFRELLALPLSFAEFAPAARAYPIAFVSADQGKTFVAMAVFGLEKQRNLFVGADDTWENGAYLPAYVRRHPFCMTRVAVDGKEHPERIACVEKYAIDDAGEPLYDAKGEPLPAWETRRKLLFEFEADLLRTEEMSRRLAALGVLEEFTMQAVPNQGEPLAMTGLYRVSESKLHDLAADTLKELARAGILARVYAHLMSLANFGSLLERHAARGKAVPRT
jgi:hypothetical protein